MGPLFQPSATVLNFGPRHHARWEARQDVLWPAWAYRVVAPKIQPRKLNLIERTILRLAQAGMIRVEEIADLMTLHLDLVSLVHGELKDRALLDAFGLPTEDGLRLLRSDETRDEDLVTGFVFQDTFSGELMPRFVEHLVRSEVEQQENGYPLVIEGTRGSPREIRPFIVRPGSTRALANPTPELVVEAIARNARAVKLWRKNKKNHEEIGEFRGHDEVVSRVSFIEERPLLVYLLTYLYVPESTELALDWYACDPFGMGHSARLRNLINARLATDSALRERVDRLFSKSKLHSLNEHFRYLEAIRQSAPHHVELRLPGITRSHPSYKQLVRMEEAHQEVELLGSACPDWKVDNFLRESTKVLEDIFGHIESSFPIDAVGKLVAASPDNRHQSGRKRDQRVDRIWLRARLEASFRALGFSERLPSRLATTGADGIAKVARRKDPSTLGAFIVATALVAEANPDHPFATAAREAPDLLGKIARVIDAGAPAGHANSEQVTPEQAKLVLEDAYFIASKLLGFSSAQAVASA